MTISKVVNAFFRWEFNSCESIVRGGEVYPIDYANATPDVALTSLHYYFPWAITALVRWSAFCLAEGRRMRLDVDARPWFDDRRRRVAHVRGEARRVPAARGRPLPGGARMRSSATPRCRISRLRRTSGSRATSSTGCSSPTVRSTFPAHEHEQFVAHYRGLVGAWSADQPSATASRGARARPRPPRCRRRRRRAARRGGR